MQNQIIKSTNNFSLCTIYKQLYAANSLAKIVDPATEDNSLKFYLAQALATRAFDYFTLAQLYQHTYVGNESKLCVPLITDLNADEVASNGCPRATVEEVYAQIMAERKRIDEEKKQKE